MVTKEELEKRKQENADYTLGLRVRLDRSIHDIRQVIKGLKKAGRKTCVTMIEWETLQSDTESIASDLSDIAISLSEDIAPYDDECEDNEE